MKKTIKN